MGENVLNILRLGIHGTVSLALELTGKLKDKYNNNWKFKVIFFHKGSF